MLANNVRHSHHQYLILAKDGICTREATHCIARVEAVRGRRVVDDHHPVQVPAQPAQVLHMRNQFIHRGTPANKKN